MRTPTTDAPVPAHASFSHDVAMHRLDVAAKRRARERECERRVRSALDTIAAALGERVRR